MPNPNLSSYEISLIKDENIFEMPFSYFISRENYSKIKNYYSNGLSKYIQNIRIENVSDIDKCKSLWEEFSQKKSIFDSWDFRKSFLSAYNYKLHFIVIKKERANLALLPLWYEKNDFWSKEKYFCFMGGYFNENNIFRAKDKNLVPLLLFIAPSPLWLDAIMVETDSPFIDSFKLVPDDPKYVLDLENLTSVEDYLLTFKKKKRYNLKRDKKIIDSYKPVLVFNNFEHLDRIIEMNKKRFRESVSDWEDPRKVRAFKNVIKNSGQEYNLKMISVLIGGKVVASDLIGTHKDTYYPLRGGSNIEEYPGLGNYMNLIEIDDAIMNGFKYIDFLQTDCGWKKSMNFREIPLFKYRSS